MSLPCSNSIMMATEVTGLVMDAIEKMAFTGIAISCATLELTGCAFVEHALAADDEGDDARRVAATDSIAHLARQRGLARVRKSFCLCRFGLGESAVSLSGRAPRNQRSVRATNAEEWRSCAVS